MSLLTKFAEQVSRQETRGPPRGPARRAAVEDLIGQICTANWATAEDREAAQGLVHRLAKLLWAAVPDPEQQWPLPLYANRPARRQVVQQ